MVVGNERFVYDQLVQAAGAGKRVSYQDMASVIGLDIERPRDRQEIYQVLNHISSGENLAGRPLLSAVVVHPEIGYPEMGFFLLARELGLDLFCDERSFYYHELKKVYEFWATGILMVKKPRNSMKEKYLVIERVV